MNEKQHGLEIRVGLFVSAGAILIMLAVLLLGGGSSLFSRPLRYEAHFSGIDGLFQGAKVVLGGLSVGRVESVDLVPETGDIRAKFTVASKFQDYIRQGTQAEILTQGVLGDKYVGLNVGTRDAPVLASGSVIPRREGGSGFSAVLSKSDQLMTSLNSVSASLDRILKSLDSENTQGGLFRNFALSSKNLASSTEKLNQALEGGQLKKATQSMAAVLEKINSGTGTIGALINDPGLYDDARALLGGANRNRIIRNLVRQTVKEGDAETAKEAKDAIAAPANKKK